MEQAETQNPMPDERPTNRGHFKVGNTKAAKHNVTTLERRGPEALPDVTRESARLFYEQGLRDLGGIENITAIELGQLQNLTRVRTKIELFDAFLTEHGVLTSRGRQRTCVSTFLAACAMYDRIATRLGMTRRAKPARRTLEDLEFDGDEVIPNAGV